MWCVVTVDTLRPDHLHCYGYPNIETPALDSLAQRGVLFENAVAQTPLTPPSHASIFTGQNPNVHNVRNTGGFVLQSSSHPLARILQEQGWDTAAFIGSAVLKKLFGFNNGFGVYDDEMPRPGKRNEFREDPERKASVMVDRAIDWLNQQAVRQAVLPLGAHVRSAHPVQSAARVRAEVQGPSVRRRDRLRGPADRAPVRRRRERTRPPDKTVTAVLSDHGESLGEHGEHTHGVFIYDSTLRIAVHHGGPGHPRRRAREAAGAHHRFLADAARSDGRPRARRTCKGVSLVPAFSGKPSRRTSRTRRRCTRR